MNVRPSQPSSRPPTTVSEQGAVDCVPDQCNDVMHVPVIPGFVFLNQLGSGTFGTVFKFHDTTLDRAVAIKVPKFPSNAWPVEETALRFLHEARTAANLDHPH